VENTQPLLYSEQLGYPAFSADISPDEFKKAVTGANSSTFFLLYLDVWERHITYLQDGRIRETALGGPDTCSRAQVFWQLRVLRRNKQKKVEDDLTCVAADTLLQLGTGKLRALAKADKPPQELCVIPPESNYRGPENQLYRVEVHQGGTVADGAAFKWSRENGSVAFPIRKLAGSTVTLGSLGRDRRFGLKPGDWVEVQDDVILAALKPGVLARVETVTREDSSVTLIFAGGGAAPAYDDSDIEAKHPLLRRWDHQGDLKKFGGALPILEQPDTDAGRKDGWLELEDGVKVWFAQGGTYRPGDYWLIPARTITGDIEWPQEPDSAGKTRPAAVWPHGIRHHYAPILLIGFTQDASALTSKITDCRCRVLRQPCAK
jgi:hypothetical protein